MRYNLRLYEQLSEYTLQVVESDMHYWKEVEIPKYIAEPKVLFMGTGGNPANVIEQVRQTGGFILYLPGFILAVDPGPGAIWHVKRNKIDLRGLNGIFISHGHSDHYLGAPIVIEAMTRVMSQRRGLLLLPEELTEENLISVYHHGLHHQHEGYIGGPKKVIHLEAGNKIMLTKSVSLIPIRAYHGKENYGFVITTPEMTIGYTSDTSYLLEYENLQGEIKQVEKWAPIDPPKRIIRYREDIKEIFSQVDYLIANVSYFNLFGQRHITAIGLAHLLENSQVKKCWMTHLDVCCTRPEPIAEEMADFVKEFSGVEIEVAQDNQEYLFK